MIKIAKVLLNFSSKYICELVLVICIILTFSQQISDDKWKGIIRSDGLGYYAYLPAVFIYHDYKFDFLKAVDSTYNRSNNSDGFLKKKPQGRVNKYYIGLSILWLPFFLLGHFISLLLGGVPDGYSYYYQLAIVFAANVYLWIGIKCTRKLILQYSVSEHIAAFIILLIVFGEQRSSETILEG